ncbi:PTI1-like tyrosine-protein kinase 1 [Panicum hallii]|uniref:PTI1-like tyrosine-protein kinase 1 n=1 Tax=Panicum hallii TaxID=206008 RepID=UPI000DF4ED47|nr:PTI1-like tyrosine-protein kinase 1 [Panicum hallii]
MEADVFRALLHFVYTDTLRDCHSVKQQKEAAMAQHLLVAADRYNLERLKLICEEKLCKHIDTVFGYGQIEHKPISEGQDWTVQAIDMSKFLVAVASGLRHENVVRLLGYNITADLPVLLYEFAGVGTLHDVLHGPRGAPASSRQPPAMIEGFRAKIAEHDVFKQQLAPDDAAQDLTATALWNRAAIGYYHPQ